MAASMLVLLLTGLLPQFGFKFAWVVPHWIAGLILTASLVFHVVRAIASGELGSMWITGADLRGLLRRDHKPGKYSVAQQSMHHAVTVFCLLGVVTGLAMMVKIDTPFWERDPYWLEAFTWGVIYALHGLVAVVFVTLTIVHVYFSLRPEKRFYTRSMIRGWITGSERDAHHDAKRWQP